MIFYNLILKVINFINSSSFRSEIMILKIFYYKMVLMMMLMILWWRWGVLRERGTHLRVCYDIVHQYDKNELRPRECH